MLKYWRLEQTEHKALSIILDMQKELLVCALVYDNIETTKDICKLMKMDKQEI